MKTVAYIRVSTEDQSLRRQNEDLEQFAKTKGLTIVKTFDDIISGSKVSIKVRDGFRAMEKYLDENLDIKNIIVLELSRLGRRNNDIQNVVEKYVERGTNIHIDDLNISTLNSDGSRSFASEILISMLGVMAANESRLLSSRIKSGKMSKARENKAFSGKITGYKKAEDGTPEIDEKNAPLIRRIFELASQSVGARSISDIIESEYKKTLKVGTISGIIRNSFYKGERKYKDLILDVKPIVSEETWESANDNIDSRKKFTSRKYAHVNLVQGKIKCYICGNVMHQYVLESSRANQFRCKNTECKNVVNRPWLFEQIRCVVEKHAKISKDKKVRKQIGLKITSGLARIESNIKELEKLKGRRRRTLILSIDNYEDVELKNDYERIIEEIKIRINKIEKENTKLSEDIKTSENALKSDIEHFSDNLELFKTEITEILNRVEVWKEFVAINLFGWREHIVMKPKSGELGWKTRRKKSNKGIDNKNEDVPNIIEVDYIEDEELEIMINHMINGQDDFQEE